MSLTGRQCSNPQAAWVSRRLLVCGILLGTLGLVQASPDYPITAGQRRTAQQFGQSGIPLDELSPNAPDRHLVKSGDTLWDISGLYLTRPWRWPELWGMNLQQIRNPHLIYPGQVLELNKADGRAWLGLAPDTPPTLRLSPRIRHESLPDAAIPPLPPGAITAFLNETLLVDESVLASAARIVATPEERAMLSQGDLAYARGQYGNAGNQTGHPLQRGPGLARQFRIVRHATPLRDPDNGEILGHEARHVGRAVLERGEGEQTESGPDGKPTARLVPATISIVQAGEEIRVGDRLLPEPQPEPPTFVPHSPAPGLQGRVVSVYGDAARFAGQHQVVTINRGTRDGLERGHVLTLLRDSSAATDPTDAPHPELRLPDENNGRLLVFRPFERLSYALVLQIADGVKVGDRFVTP